MNRVWKHTSVIPAFGKWKQEDQRFQLHSRFEDTLEQETLSQLELPSSARAFVDSWGLSQTHLGTLPFSLALFVRSLVDPQIGVSFPTHSLFFIIAISGLQGPLSAAKSFPMPILASFLSHTSLHPISALLWCLGTPEGFPKTYLSSLSNTSLCSHLCSVGTLVNPQTWELS